MPDAGAPPLLEVDIRRKDHAGERGSRLAVIADLRFRLADGAVTSLVGPSGCGKSTALRIAMGLDNAFEGTVTPPPASLRLGVVFQEPRLLPWRTVEENIRLVAPDLAEPALDALLVELGLDAWRRHRPRQLSGGMARRVALARALAIDPMLLVLDEAFVSLDEAAAEALRAAVFAAVDRRGIGVLMVTHDIREALRHSDTILLLAPRPTRVARSVTLRTPRAARTAAWIEGERQALLRLPSGAAGQEPPQAPLHGSSRAPDPQGS